MGAAIRRARVSLKDQDTEPHSKAACQVSESLASAGDSGAVAAGGADVPSVSSNRKPKRRSDALIKGESWRLAEKPAVDQPRAF